MSYINGFFIGIGKAITPVETNKTDCTACLDCFFNQQCHNTSILCTANCREDGKNVVFKLIDLSLNVSEDKKNV